MPAKYHSREVVYQVLSVIASPFAVCHSEGAKRPKNLAQDRLRRGNLGGGVFPRDCFVAYAPRNDIERSRERLLGGATYPALQKLWPSHRKQGKLLPGGFALACFLAHGSSRKGEGDYRQRFQCLGNLEL